MVFWLFCLCMVLLIPVTLLFLGWTFQKKPPKTINRFYGYRTPRSMKSRETWVFAHHTCGRLWVWLGKVLLPVSAAAMLPVLGRDADMVGLWCGVIALIQTTGMAGSIFFVERALKQHFDDFGGKR